MKASIDSGKNVIRFKEILLELHRGAEPSALFEQFHEVISNASNEEYEEIKHQMIVEGVPQNQALKWQERHTNKKGEIADAN